MEMLQELREKLMNELKEEGNKVEKITPACLDVIYKLIESVKGIDKIEMLNGESGYSERRGVMRDSRGRYSGAWYGESNGYGYDTNRYSRHSRMDMLEEELERMINTARSDREREAIGMVIDRIHNG